jgi:hypothetical protein
MEKTIKLTSDDLVELIHQTQMDLHKLHLGKVLKLEIIPFKQACEGERIAFEPYKRYGNSLILLTEVNQEEVHLTIKKRTKLIRLVYERIIID